MQRKPGNHSSAKTHAFAAAKAAKKLAYFRKDQMVKNPPAMQENWVQSLGQEDLLEKGMTTHSSMLAWRMPWTEEPGRLQSKGLQRVKLLKQLSTHAQASNLIS